MILKARDDFGLDLARSALVGDKDSDLEAGRAAGVGYNLKLARETPGAIIHEPLHFTSLYDMGAWLGRTFGRSSPG